MVEREERNLHGNEPPVVHNHGYQVRTSGREGCHLSPADVLGQCHGLLSAGVVLGRITGGLGSDAGSARLPIPKSFGEIVRTWKTTGVVGAMVLAVTLSGCVSGADSSSPTSERDASGTGFSGPWAEEFRTGWNEAVTDLERQILADGVVTEQELIASRETLISCLAAQGVTITFDERGGGETRSDERGVAPEAQGKILEACERETGIYVDFLYWQGKRNPDNLDEFTIVARCLVDRGIVEPGYSAKDYERDFNDEFPFSDTDMVAGECLSNPLGMEY